MNEHEEKMFLDILNERSGCGRTLLYGCILALVVFCLCGCKTKYIPVETIKTEYIVRTDTFTQKDSCVVRDSVYIHEKGDTVWYEKWHTQYVDRWRERVKIDTLIRRDSIRTPYPVERELTKWEQIKMDYGAVSIGISIAAVIGLILWLILWLKRKGLV